MEVLDYVHEHVLALLKYFDQFCRENDIEYFMFYGTLLGAVRHKGFIPWDDDVDLGMDRENFQKFMQVRERLKAGLQCINEDGVVRLWDAGADKVKYACHDDRVGVFIDVFCFGRVTAQQKAFLEKGMVPNRLWAYRKTLQKKSQLLYGLYSLLMKPLYMLDRYLWFPYLTRKLKAYTQENRGDFLAWDGMPDLTFPLKDELYPLKRMTFEDAQLPVPNNPHALLVKMYGPNYMTPLKRELGVRENS